jgi:hypothetical protein
VLPPGRPLEKHVVGIDSDVQTVGDGDRRKGATDGLGELITDRHAVRENTWLGEWVG